MGIFAQKIKVGPLTGSRFETVDLMVDTGSAYTWIPKRVVERLGVRPSGSVRVRLANGKVISKNGVNLLVRINGDTRSNFCLVAAGKDALLLGSLTLETFSLGVDPINKKLVPVVSFAAGSI